MYRISQILFVAGTILAIASAAKMPEKVGDFPDTWPVAVAGAILAAIGVGLWRLQVRKALEAVKSGETATDGPNAAQLLTDMQAPMAELTESAGAMDATALEAKVDELMEAWVLPFAEARQQIIDRFGMATGAEILVTVAYGERMLNRVWSAAADGHLPEARACVPEATDALAEAARLLEAAGKNA